MSGTAGPTSSCCITLDGSAATEPPPITKPNPCIVKPQECESTVGVGRGYKFARSRHCDEGNEMRNVIAITAAMVLAATAARLSAEIQVSEDEKQIKIS